MKIPNRFFWLKCFLTHKGAQGNLFLILFLQLSLVCRAQVTQNKKDLDPSDYNLWSHIKNVQLSPGGQWASYTLSYDAADTLFVKKLDGKNTYAFAGHYSGKFISEKSFASLKSEKGLSILDLATGSQNIIKDVLNYEIVNKATLLCTASAQNGSVQSLLILDAQKSVLARIPAERFAYNATAQIIAVVHPRGTTQEILFVSLSGVITDRIELPTEYDHCTAVAWKNEGDKLAFIIQDRAMLRSAVGCYNLKNKKCTVLDAKTCTQKSGKRIVTSTFTPLLLSADGKRIFFGLEGISTLQPLQPGVEIWNTSDKALFPYKAEAEHYAAIKPRVCVWWPDTGRVRQITDSLNEQVFLNASQTHAITSKVNVPAGQDRDSYVMKDYDITCLETGKRLSLLRDFPDLPGFIEVSPNGNIILYFINGQWWSYTIASGLHKNITGGIDSQFSVRGYDNPDHTPAYGIAGWTDEGNTVLLYDKYDIWAVTTDGNAAKKLTSGIGQHMASRLAPSSAKKGTMNFNGGLILNVYRDSEHLLLETTSPLASGFSLLKKGKVKSMLSVPYRCTQAVYSQASGGLLYTREHYNKPPQIIFSNNATGKEKVVYESNRQHVKYNWGLSKKINYKLQTGEALQAALFYPAGYQHGKKYPMIVHIYERRSAEYNHYVNPSLHNVDGFNLTNYTTQGYFVLLPDIAYQVGNPGPSALSCVVAATNSALQNTDIDPKKVGLIGHSFGGYETAFILTQTNMFRAGVAGAAVTDFITSYLYGGSYTAKTDYWRYEAGQMRMKRPLFENWDGYQNNSPLFHAAQINTPLLTWTGGNDFQVYHEQSMELYMALRRLNKTNTMLIYPAEGHILLKEKNQEDLTLKIQDWFNYYLKGIPIPHWLPH